ncbi:MAG: flagellar FlbD family protein [Bryobacteraceae bacterium]
MIQLTRINHTALFVNPDQIEHIDTAPDTILTFSNGRNLMVLETPAEIVQRVISFKRQVYLDFPKHLSSAALEFSQS